MRHVCMANVTALTVTSACGFLARARGLIGRPPLLAGEALWIAPCSALHTAFMRCAIDAVFVSRAGLVKRVCTNLKPWRMACCWGSEGVLELKAGEALRLQLRPGQRLRRSGSSDAR
jgi:uncharacterized protein